MSVGDLSRWNIELGPNGPRKVEIDAIDYSEDVVALNLFSAPGQPTSLNITLGPGAAHIQGKGVVVQHVAIGDPIAAIKELSADEIERRSLDKLDWGSGSSLAAKMLDTIVEMLGESQSDPRPEGN